MVKLIAIGHLGKDAVVNDVNGNKVINFSIAHTEKWTDAKGVNQERTLWIECAKWGDKVGVADYLKKGTQVYVEGQPEVRTYDKKDGGTGVSLALRVGVVQLLGSAQGKTQSGAEAAGVGGGGSEAAPSMDLGAGSSNMPF